MTTDLIPQTGMRRWSGIALGALALLGASAAAPAWAADLHVLNWKGYGTDEPWAVAEFEKQTGVHVVHDAFNSEQEMLTKLRTNPGVYDVVLINSIYNAEAAKGGLIEPIETGKLTNYADLTPTFRDHAYLQTDGKPFGVPWVWGVTAVAVNADKVKPVPTSIKMLWDPAFKGKVALRDDAIEVVQLAAIASGQDMNHPADLAKISELLKGMKPQIKTFWSSEDEWNKDFSASQFVVSAYWSGSANRSKRKLSLPVAFVIPDEGAIGWFDSLAVPAKAPNRDAAYKFIDYMVGPGFYTQWDGKAGAPAPVNTKAIAALPADAFNRAVMGDPAILSRLKFMAPIAPAERQKYLDLWQETKTFYAQ